MADPERGLIKTAMLLALGIGHYFYKDVLEDWKEKLVLRGEEEWEDLKSKSATKADIDALSQKIDRAADQAKAILLQWGKQ